MVKCYQMSADLNDFVMFYIYTDSWLFTEFARLVWLNEILYPNALLVTVQERTDS